MLSIKNACLRSAATKVHPRADGLPTSHELLTMSVAIEAFYIFDDQICLLEHVYNGRPPTAKDLLPRLREQTPRPAVLHLPNLNPPTNAYTVLHGGLSLVCTSSKDAPPQAVIDFLYRVSCGRRLEKFCDNFLCVE